MKKKKKPRKAVDFINTQMKVGNPPKMINYRS